MEDVEEPRHFRERLVAGLALARTRYTPTSSAAALTQLLTNPSFLQSAQNAATQIRSEDALSEACNAIESALHH